MNILLINPYCLDTRIQDYDIRVPPIGLYYLGAILKEKGHDCEILNWYSMKGHSALMKKELERLKPDLVGISILHANRWGGIEIARLVKETVGEVPVIFGGPGATFLHEHLLTHFPEIDAIVLGEGEISCGRLVEHIDREGLNQLELVPGIAFREKGRVVKTEPPGFIKDLDSLPDPARYFGFQHVISSRGCPWNCSFCGSPRIWKRTVRFHSPEYFVRQLQRLKDKGINFFFVSDDTFTLKKERVIKICQLILERQLDIDWVAISRVNIVDEDILYWMRRAGCIQISYGVESGSPKIRKILNKDITDKQIKTAFELTREYGLMPRAYFIYGNPGETKETIRQSIRLMDKIKPLGAIFYILDIFPGTQLYDEFKARARCSDDIWLEKVEDIMYFQTDPSLDEHRVLAYGKKLRTSFYKGLPRYVKSLKLRDLPELAPHHADFLSRLAMTFAFGDYSQIREIPNSQEMAIMLFQRSLEYFPDHRAYLGLAMIYQRTNQHGKALQVLDKGLKHFPFSPELNGCKGVSLMGTGDLEQALDIFLRFDNTIQNIKYALACAEALGKLDIKMELEKRLIQMQKRNQHHVPGQK